MTQGPSNSFAQVYRVMHQLFLSSPGTTHVVDSTINVKLQKIQNTKHVKHKNYEHGKIHKLVVACIKLPEKSRCENT